MLVSDIDLRAVFKQSGNSHNANVHGQNAKNEKLVKMATYHRHDMLIIYEHTAQIPDYIKISSCLEIAQIFLWVSLDYRFLSGNF
jgi:hypothetical protein